MKSSFLVTLIQNIKQLMGHFAMLEKDHVIQVGRDSRLDNIEFDSIDVGTLYVITKVVENKDNTFEVDKTIMGRKEIDSPMSENVQIGLCARRNAAGRFDFIPNYDFQKLRLSEDKQYYFRVQTVSSINKDFGPTDIDGKFAYSVSSKMTIYGEKFELPPFSTSTRTVPSRMLAPRKKQELEGEDPSVTGVS